MRWETLGRLVVITGLTCMGCGGDGGTGESGGDESGDSQDVDGGNLNEDAATGDVAEDVLNEEDIQGAQDVLDAAAEDVPVVWPNIVINEVMVKADGNYPDWVELTSLHGETVDLGGWGIRDELNAHEYTLPEGTMLEAFSYKVIWGKGGDQELTMDFGFKVDAKARLFTPDGTQVDEADWNEGDAPAGTTWGRFPDGHGDFQMLTEPTLGKANKPPEESTETEEEAP